MNLTSNFSRPLLRHGLAGLALATAGVTFASAAVTWHDIQFGGFASQGYIVNSGVNDYLGHTSGDGTFDFREYAANASWSKGRFRVGAQAFGQKLGAYGGDKIKLDWATVDYQATQWFGVRAGRVKMPRGLYNEALDLDSVRPFVLLPQSIYDNRLRDFDASFDGGMIYGNVGLKSAGSLDYRAFYGHIPIARDSGAADYFNNDIIATVLKIKMDSVHGGSLFWNTPVAGLRVGYSYSKFRNMTSNREASLASMTLPPSGSLPTGPSGQPMLPPDLPPIALTPGATKFTKSTPSYDRHLVSLEYSKGDWLFAAEAGREQAFYSTFDFASGLRVLTNDYVSDTYYLSAARRINRWLELGTYYSHSRDNQQIGNSAFARPALPDLLQGDFALSTKFDLNDHVIFKLEGHYMDGSGKLYSTVARPQPSESRDNSWLMFAAKVTVSF